MDNNILDTLVTHKGRYMKTKIEKCPYTVSGKHIFDDDYVRMEGMIEICNPQCSNCGLIDDTKETREDRSNYFSGKMGDISME